MNFLKELKVNYTLSALVCVVLGLVLVIWPRTSTRIVCMVLGAALLIYGIVQIVIYLVNRERTLILQGLLVLGIIFAVIGAWILVKPEMIMMAVPVIVGILIIIHGLHNISQAINLKKQEYEKWWLALIFGLLTVILGGVLVYNPFTVVDTVVRMIGIFLIYDGTSDVWILSRIFHVKRKAEQVVDAQYREMDEE